MGAVKEVYSATVTSNADDEQRGRIKVACAQLLGDEDTELPMWVEPVFDWGWFYVPDVGETVDVEVTVDSDEDEIRGQMSIDNLDIHWKGQRYYTDDVTLNPNTTPTIVHPDFIGNYGKRRGFATPHGHIFMFDDDPVNPTIWLTFQKAPLEGQPLPPTYTRVEIEKDGSLKVGAMDKHLLHLQTDDNKLYIGLDRKIPLVGDYQQFLEFEADTPKITVSMGEGKQTLIMDGTEAAPKLTVSLADGDHTLTMDGTTPTFNVEVSLDKGAHKLKLDGAAPSLEVNLANGAHNLKLNDGQFTANVGGGASIDVSDKDADAVATVGDGAVSAAIAEHLKTYIDTTVKAEFDAHIHPTGMGPSGPPTVPLTGYDDNITSGHMKFPDG